MSAASRRKTIVESMLLIVPLLLLAVHPMARAEVLELDSALFLQVSDDPLGKVDPRPPTASEFVRSATRRSLPDYWDINGPTEGGRGWYLLDFLIDPRALEEPTPWAIYLPKHDREIEVFLNGELIGSSSVSGSRLANNWLYPYLFTVHANQLVAGTNQIAVRLSGYNYDATLGPVFVGWERELVGAYRWRYGFHVGVAQVTVGWVVLLAAGMFLFWMRRPAETQYLCFSAACLCAGIYSLDRFVRGFPEFASDSTWSIFFNGMIAVHALFLTMFLHRFLQVRRPRLETGYAAVIVGYFLFALLGGYTVVPIATNSLHLASALIGGYMMYVIYRYRNRNAPVDSYAVIAVCLTVYLFNINDYALRLFEPPHMNINLLQWAPILMSLAMLWLVFSRLLQTLAGFEQLNAELTDRVETKSREVVELGKQALLREERERMVGELHDGLGSHLVRAVMLMRTPGDASADLLPTLNAALTDLRLIVTAMDPEETDTMELLGDFRARIEPFLKSQGIELGWQLEAETLLPGSETAAKLDLLRILQEAVTNAVRHARASRITIATSPLAISVRDNGAGMGDAYSAGTGLASMRRRASRLGAQLEVTSSASGTEVRLAWAAPTP